MVIMIWAAAYDNPNEIDAANIAVRRPAEINSSTTTGRPELQSMAQEDGRSSN
ncbi:hypothetical protein ACLQ28_33660 [Micromonospora sp. DT201]|uniref:hypothetical protein n=1 Tax=Micromonospora sp. DT201 TaxID=3393442 RepID=UPI003CF6206D